MTGTSLTLYAKWTANPDTPYEVKHYQVNLGVFENFTAENSTLVETEKKTGTTDSKITPEVKSYEGFVAPATQTTTIPEVKARASIVLMEARGNRMRNETIMLTS